MPDTELRPSGPQELSLSSPQATLLPLMSQFLGSSPQLCKKLTPIY